MVRVPRYAEKFSFQGLDAGKMRGITSAEVMRVRGDEGQKYWWCEPHLCAADSGLRQHLKGRILSDLGVALAFKETVND